MNADRNLLFGRLAVHNGFIDQAAFDEAHNQQQTNPSQSLAEVLVQGGSISEEDHGFEED